ncbi:metallopeptidase family protein [Janibacter sp. HTCC2649]|uniref:metallopeptidase family protein n=1 Tax=Janibacter sp. HTCC2649 TaxID=313589 RepID=UPI000A050634|nr:metallopeptidase family protein [Janibacter sp. HTCC2649]
MAPTDPRNSAQAPRRDRRGRGPRGPLAWPPVPAMRTRRETFDDVVIEVAERARAYLGTRYADVEFAVEEVPPTDPAPWEEQAAAVGRLLPVGGTVGHRIVIYRRPVETRARDVGEVAAIVREVVAEQVAALLNVPPSEIEL